MPIEGVFSGLHISASGMRAQRIRQNAISSNLANIETTRTAEGGPYRREYVVLTAETEDKDTRLVNKRKGLDGRETRERHVTIPPEDFPRDERFFGRGVRVAEIRKDTRPPKMIHDPSHPDADADGYVAMPNINPVQEMADMIAATRAYEANVTAFNATKGMLMQALQL